MIYPYEVNHRASLTRIFKRRMHELLIDKIDHSTPLDCGTIRPIFVVGCGHSGTTLVATQLFQNPQVLPIARETHIFHPLRSLSRTKCAVSKWIFISQVLGVSAFVEKTPKHIHSIGKILSLIPSATIVFVHRDPLETIASLSKRFDDLEFCIERYDIDNWAGLEATRKFENVVSVPFREFKKEPEPFIQDILQILGEEKSSDQDEEVTNYHARVKSGLLDERVSQVSKKVNSDPKTMHTLAASDRKLISNRTKRIASLLGY